MKPGPTLSHFGICVSDLEASVHFYTEGLGFEVAESFNVGHEFAALMELDGVKVRSQFLRRGTDAIELLSFSAPPATGGRGRRPLNQFGLTHLSFRVDDVDSVVTQLVALGGAVHESTRTTTRGEDGTIVMDFVYCTDPDGVRVELMRLPGS